MTNPKVEKYLFITTTGTEGRGLDGKRTHYVYTTNEQE